MTRRADLFGDASSLLVDRGVPIASLADRDPVACFDLADVTGLFSAAAAVENRSASRQRPFAPELDFDHDEEIGRGLGYGRLDRASGPSQSPKQRSLEAIEGQS